MASHRWPYTYAQERAHIHSEQVRMTVKFHCCSHGIQTMTMAYYYCFGLELDRHVRKYGGGDLSVRIAQRLIAKWTEKGLKPDMLRTLVYALTNVRLEGDGT